MHLQCVMQLKLHLEAENVEKTSNCDERKAKPVKISQNIFATAVINCELEKENGECDNAKR
jgi:hypothetical protein